ncbi:M81 family metallopeptidase [Roseomonas frigidaquae]|uniref:Microcystinase C n=1 Tax=Falsiroseomonas frigidaquae TaxID=487318 RepID=A0ABX1F1W2_9PROT|nr:M81 family metallopeptidase [Falsiroseomonas frigidaquae]NKE46279.1 M81 family metallopeptidase [Falsiroseomonas frigidaquae]
MTRHVLLASIKHESHTFNRFPTSFALIRRQGWREGTAVVQAYRDTGSEMAGFLDVAEAAGWHIMTPIAMNATSGGRVAADAFAAALDALEAGIKAAGKLDGILLALHGAMAAEGEDDADGAILSRVRTLVGPDIPLAATLDLHANVSDRMAASANILVSYRTNPHVDHRETAHRAAQLLMRAMESGVLPVSVVERAPTLVGFDRGRTHTGHGPMIDALAEADRLERDVPGVLAVSVNGGYSHADMQDAGPSVIVTGEGDAALLREYAASLMRMGYERRAEETVRLATIPEAIAAMREGPFPCVVADYTDAPGGGAYGDATPMLRAMIEAGLTNAAFGAIFDPKAAAMACDAGEGARLHLSFGGWIDPAFSGAPIEAEVEVRHVSDGAYVHDGPYAPGTCASFGRSALVRVGGVDVILSTENKNILDLQQFRIFGLEPARLSAIGLKCMHGFRAAFEPIAARVLACDAGGLTTYQYERLGFTRVRRPVWPLDAV